MDYNSQNSVKCRFIFSQNAGNCIPETPDLKIFRGTMTWTPLARSRAFHARNFHPSFHTLVMTPLINSAGLASWEQCKPSTMSILSILWNICLHIEISVKLSIRENSKSLDFDRQFAMDRRHCSEHSPRNLPWFVSSHDTNSVSKWFESIVSLCLYGRFMACAAKI